MIYFTSDTHLNHKNIIKYCNRPFKNINEMNETIVENWNNTVHPTDTIYHLGDFSFGESIREFTERLNGKIILIKGNHDHFNIKKMNMFYRVYDMLEIKIDSISITLCHYAMRVWNKSHFNSWNLYGHSHSMLKPIGKQYDVGVDNNNFTPISFDQIKTIMKDKPNNFNYIGD
ncbi:MAG: metallophosphoesterase family protein [bacterium]